MKQKMSNYPIVHSNFIGVVTSPVAGGGGQKRRAKERRKGGGKKMYGYPIQNTAFLACLVRLHCCQNMATLDVVPHFEIR